ncbi:MAG TPA: sugar ABC transporter substrate-binding protein [Thermodesulfobacteriota bacterium]
MGDNPGRSQGTDPKVSRRRFLAASAQLGAAAAVAPGLLASRAYAQGGGSLEAYRRAKIDWQQAKGETINVAVIPASYFDNLIAITPTFEQLTGITVRYEKIPPGQIRQKAVLDLTAKTGTYHTHAADPMYYPLYVSNRWVEPLDEFLRTPSLTDAAWFDYDDIIPAWRNATKIGDATYGVPYDGEVTIQVYRKDLYDAKGLEPAETLDELMANAKAVHDPGNRVWGAALRGFPGAGQNMYIYPSLFRAFGGEWFEGKKPAFNSQAAVEALEYYIELLTKYAPPGVQNWNWPDIADAFSQGTVGVYIDAHSSAAVLNNPEKSKVIGKIGYARWPKGPSGKRVTSIWNWSFPINAALSKTAKVATWLFIQWAASTETQIRTSYRFEGPVKRAGVNRQSLWRSPEYQKAYEGWGADFIQATLESLEHDTDVEWRPRVPQWPAIGDTMATAIQSALVGQAKPKEALDAANAKIAQFVRA